MYHVHENITLIPRDFTQGIYYTLKFRDQPLQNNYTPWFLYTILVMYTHALHNWTSTAVYEWNET